jgi:hypothetical protein
MDSKPFEELWTDWAAQRWPDENERRRHAWVLAAVKQHMRWGAGKEVSAAELTAAADEVLGLTIGGGGIEAAPSKR